MDGANWHTPDDVYNAFFQAVGAPSWHGRNFNALRDSIATGHVNKIEIPYVIKIKNFRAIGTGAADMVGEFVRLIRELRATGCPVDIELQD